MTLKEWRAIVVKAIDQAKRGDSKARQWLSDYLAGKPVQGVDLGNRPGEELLIRYVNDWRDTPTDSS